MLARTSGLIAALLLLGCGDETEPSGRFDDGGGGHGGGLPTGGAGMGGAGAAGNAGGAGQGGGATGPQEVCVGTSLTVGDLTLLEGDAEFDGNGPIVTTTVELDATPTEVVIEACVQMRETQSDWSTGSRCDQLVVDVPNSGLAGITDFSAQYTDTDHEADNVFSEADEIDDPGKLIINLQCVGDTQGDDICETTNGDCSMCLFTLGCFDVLPP